MLNPSIADDRIDDRTVKKCMGFAKALGYGSIEIVNLFAYIATDPKELSNIIMSEGQAGKMIAIRPDNDKHIKSAAKRSDIIVAGWGNHASPYERPQNIAPLLLGKKLRCVHINNSGHPKHPLYHPYLSIIGEDSLLIYTA